MNSMSRGYYEPCGKIKNMEGEKCPVITKCGCPGSATIPASTPVGTNFTLASLTVDSSCICDPNIKVEFISNIVAPTGTTAGAFSVQIYKQCKYQIAPVPVGSSWTFSTTSPTSQTFSFFICDSDSCINDCCTYTAIATVTTQTAGAAISINNSSISTLVTCKNSCSRCK